jgi:hypothetical protein
LQFRGDVISEHLQTYQDVLQVNVRISDNAPAGNAVPLAFRLTGSGSTNYDSQPGVTL